MPFPGVVDLSGSRPHPPDGGPPPATAENSLTGGNHTRRLTGRALAGASASRVTGAGLRVREAASARRHWLWLIAIGCVSVVLPLLASALSGNLAIPHNDAWSMSRIAETFARTGRIRLLNWNDMNLIGQVVMLGPLGSSIIVQQSVIALLSLLCLLCAYRLLAMSLSPRDAVLGTALLGLWPGWASLSTSFDTDVPTFAATFVALLLGWRALRRDSVGWLAAALLVSLWAVSIREQAIVAPMAILTYGWLTRRSRQRLTARSLFLAAVAGAALVTGFEVWRWGLPLGQDPRPTAGLLHFSGQLFAWGARTYFTLAVVLAPAVLVGAGRHRWVRRDCVGLVAGIVLVVLAWCCGGVVGRYLEPSGEYAQVLPGTRVVLPSGLWDALLALGCVSGGLLVPLVCRRWRSVSPLLGLFTILASAEIVVIGAAGNGVFDRYLPVLLPGVLAAVLSHPKTPSAAKPRSRFRLCGLPTRLGAAGLRRGSTVAALALVGVTSALLAANGFAFDAARWHAAQHVAKAGVSPGRIAAGLEWTGWHSPHGVLYGHDHAGQPGGWELSFYRRPACIVLTPSPLRPAALARHAAWTLAGSYVYKTFLIAGQSRLYLYRTHASGCTG